MIEFGYRAVTLNDYIEHDLIRRRIFQAELFHSEIVDWPPMNGGADFAIHSK